jgi:DNA-binding transcriptional ArsR family regulator
MKATAPQSGLDIELFEKAADRLSSIAHPTRIQIIELLLAKGPLCVTEIYKAVKIEQAGASTHLRILKEKGVLASRRDGKKIFYSVKPKAITQVIDCVNRCNID